MFYLEFIDESDQDHMDLLAKYEMSDLNRKSYCLIHFKGSSFSVDIAYSKTILKEPTPTGEILEGVGIDGIPIHTVKFECCVLEGKNNLTKKGSVMGQSITIQAYDKAKVVKHFGQNFHEKVQVMIDELIEKWTLNDLELIDSYSANLVMKANSYPFGPVLLKIARHAHEFESEFYALKAFKGKGFCQLYDMSQEHYALIETFVSPGIMLSKEKTLDKRLNAFCHLFKTIHPSFYFEEKEDYDYEYKSYENWMDNIADFMIKQEAWSEVNEHVVYSQDLFKKLWKKYDSKKLLHGDFHYYNILKDHNDYKAVDPKGVIGNPVFDLPRYMLNEYWDTDDEVLELNIKRVFQVFHEKFNIPLEDLKSLLYIEGVLANSWNIEDGMSISEKDHVLETLNELKNYMK